ncbi:MAG: restriction endonuclease, partial [Methylocystis sp.]|nr:restriction endonuclease [Methylocystis sp.]
MSTLHLVPPDIASLYEIHEWRNATGVLQTAHQEEWTEIMQALRNFRFRASDVLAPGKNKSELAKGLDTASM